MNGSVTYEGLILQGGINVDTGANLEELTVYENGVYNPSEGKDGFSKVTVDVPEAVLDDISITENGHYTPPIGVDGYNDITVSVPHPSPVLDDITITENGSYQPPTGVDGYDNITVNVPAPAPVLDDITITANGHYTPPTGTDGYDDITVNVPLPANGIYKQTLSGLPAPIATFTGADAPIDSLKASIVGVQSGSGDPSPTNIRPISGWTGCEVTDNNNTYTIPFKDSSDNPITVYDGEIDVTGGSAECEMPVIDWSTLSWTTRYTGSVNKTLSTNLPSAYSRADFGIIAEDLSYNQNVGGASILQNPDSKSVGIYGYDGSETPTIIYIVVPIDYTPSCKCAYKLATPQAIQLTPTQVRTIQGNNNISVDCGEVTECKYYSETP